MTELLQWYNLVFILPFSAALLYLLLLAFGQVPGHEGIPEVDHDMEVDHGIEHIAHDQETDHDGSNFDRALSAFGLGRIPLSISLTSFCFMWGFVGWASNLLLSSFLPPLIFFWPSLILTVICSVIFTRYLSRFLSKLIPKSETYATSRDDLLGREGVVRYQITETFGATNVPDKYGTLHEVSCRIRSGSNPIPIGTRVILAEYDKQKEAFIVLTHDQYNEEVLSI